MEPEKNVAADLPLQRGQSKNTRLQVRFLVDVLRVQVVAAVTRVCLAHRYKKDLWRHIADLLNEEFGATFTELQVKNKWKSLERAYKRVVSKCRRTGEEAAKCEFEECVFLDFCSPSLYILLSRVLRCKNVWPFSEIINMQNLDPFN